jgi:hypothetical protein
MKTVVLLLLLTYQINRSRLDYSRDLEEPEHYSWDLGQPDNLVRTDVIIIEDAGQESDDFDDY